MKPVDQVDFVQSQEPVLVPESNVDEPSNVPALKSTLSVAEIESARMSSTFGVSNLQGVVPSFEVLPQTKEWNGCVTRGTNHMKTLYGWQFKQDIPQSEQFVVQAFPQLYKVLSGDGELYAEYIDMCSKQSVESDPPLPSQFDTLVIPIVAQYFDEKMGGMCLVGLFNGKERLINALWVASGFPNLENRTAASEHVRSTIEAHLWAVPKSMVIGTDYVSNGALCSHLLLDLRLAIPLYYQLISQKWKVQGLDFGSEINKVWVGFPSYGWKHKLEGSHAFKSWEVHFEEWHEQASNTPPHFEPRITRGILAEAEGRGNSHSPIIDELNI